MSELVWRFPHACFYAQELLFLGAALRLQRVGPGATHPGSARLAAQLLLAALLLLVNRAFLPVGYLLGECTISHGRYGFPGPVQALAAVQVPLLWLLGTFGRERLREAILGRLAASPRRVALAAATIALAGAFFTTMRWGDAASLRAEALVADLGTSLTATLLLWRTGSTAVAAAFSSGWLYLAFVGVSDGESPLWSVAHVYTSGRALRHLELLFAWIPPLVLLAPALRRRTLQYAPA